MVARRFLAVLVTLATVLALTLVVAPARAGASMASMPCHDDAVPSADAASCPPRCCLPVCCAVAAFSPELTLAAWHVSHGISRAEAFTSVTVKPRVPPPRA